MKGRLLLAALVLPAFAILFHQECKAADKVVLQLRWDHQFQFAGYYAAKWQGYYEQEGLDVEIRSGITQAGQVLRASSEVWAGRADFGVDGAEILLAVDQGAPLTIMACIFQHSAARVYALNTTDLRGPGDLTRMRVAVVPGGLVGWELKAMLHSEGFDPGSMNSVPLKPPGLQQLVDGEAELLAGYSFSIPLLAGEMGLELISLQPASYGVDFYGDSLFTSAKLVAKDPGLVDRFLRASLKGWDYALDNPLEVAERIASEYQPVYRFPISRRSIVRKSKQFVSSPATRSSISATSIPNGGDACLIGSCPSKLSSTLSI
jgi:ABC-type nitrate/sulfonate/bicarbonate transport system substrate-binding protein